MKLQFNPDLDFQAEAIAAIADVFEGQEVCRTNFTVSRSALSEDVLPGFEENDLGVGNRLRLLDDDVLANVKAIQLRNGLAPSESLGDLNFTVEMETGTGKTYVYLRTVFELNRRYGFTKFIVVVPSIAIKEGVHKSLQMTEEHFRGLYDNTPFDYFVYDSQKLGDVRNFATSDSIQVMVINIDAFRKSFTDPEGEAKANIIHRPQDRMSGQKPIDFIRATSPIVIIDEPQSVDTTAKSAEAIRSLNPLCTLRYSATHVDKHNMTYRLDSVDAYQRKLVKQIEVAGIEAQDSHNKAYIKLLKVDNRKSPITAQVEIDAMQRGGTVKRLKKTVKSGDDLLEVSGGRSVYDGYIVDDIYCEKGSEYIDFTSKPESVGLGEATGGANDDEYKRQQIRKTIEEHLDKELKLRAQGIKVLSLFFIDRVAKYRWYDDDGNAQPGTYALMFEEEYRKAASKGKYRTLFADVDLDTAADGVHNGYFAIDKKKDTRGDPMLRDSRGDGTAVADEGAYQLIMRDKERLLSFDSKLKFIFSHSALREGWDNPNVFQICTLNETGSVMKKRQEIGRGLRIAVDQSGVRRYEEGINTLTVVANESYEDFARQLQQEIEDDQGIRFGVVEPHLFANIPVVGEDGETAYFGVEASDQVWNHLLGNGYIDSRGKVQDSLRRDLKSGEVDLPAEVGENGSLIVAALSKVAGKLDIKNADDRVQIKLNKAVYVSPEFAELWDRIKHRTTFRVDFDGDGLIEVCVREIKVNLSVGKARFVVRTSTLDIDRGGVTAEEGQGYVVVSDTSDFELPDIVSYLQDETSLTRRSIVQILVKSERLADFRKNPQKFIEQVAAIIKRQMQLYIVDGIKYQKLGEEHCYSQELFDDNELYGYLKQNMLESTKSVYDHVVFDADNEAAFAGGLERDEAVKVYAKLPSWFKIDTPLGSYNPDWAVLMNIEGVERLYFVVETKGSMFSDDLRPAEKAKIDCGRQHFKALDEGASFKVAGSYESFREQTLT